MYLEILLFVCFLHSARLACWQLDFHGGIKQVSVLSEGIRTGLHAAGKVSERGCLNRSWPVWQQQWASGPDPSALYTSAATFAGQSSLGIPTCSFIKQLLLSQFTPLHSVAGCEQIGLIALHKGRAKPISEILWNVSMFYTHTDSFTTVDSWPIQLWFLEPIVKCLTGLGLVNMYF